MQCDALSFAFERVSFTVLFDQYFDFLDSFLPSVVIIGELRIKTSFQ